MNPRIFLLQFRNKMIETRLGEFEEVILLLVGILEKDAYAFRFAEEFENQTRRSVSIGAVHSALTRLDSKGFLTSKMSGATNERMGTLVTGFTILAIIVASLGLFALSAFTV